MIHSRGINRSCKPLILSFYDDIRGALARDTLSHNCVPVVLEWAACRGLDTNRIRNESRKRLLSFLYDVLFAARLTKSQSTSGFDTVAEHYRDTR